MKKGKIIQVVEFNKEIELLEYRLQNFDEVDQFVIIGTVPKNVKEQEYSNVDYLELDNNDYYETLTKYLIQNCKNFEDIIIISDETEFCDFSDFDFVHSEIIYNSIFIKHLNFWWGKNYFSEERKLNSFIFSFSQLLKDEKIIERTMKIKGGDSFSDRTYFLNGWTFNGFFENQDDDFHKKNLLPRNKFPKRLKLFKENSPLPKNFEVLPDYNFDAVYKILVVCDEVSSFEDYDKIVRIFFDYDIVESVTNENNIYEFRLCLPKKVLYGNKNFDDFLSDFKKNEITRIVDLVKVSNKDIVEIKNPS